MNAAASSPVAPASRFAGDFLDGLISAGLTHLVLSPGARSQALALAAERRHDAGQLELVVRLDERDAAFTALGISLETGVATAVVTTSGSAVGNLLPAVMEAAHSGVPLLVLSADRPAELRGTGANQTTWHSGIFSRYVLAEHDIEAPNATAPSRSDAIALATQAMADASTGPAHYNLQFREPLSSHVDEQTCRANARDDMITSRALARQDLTDAAPEPTTLTLSPGSTTIVIAGTGAGAAAQQCAIDGGWPLVAEVTSGAHFGPHLVVAYRELLSEPEFGGQVRRAIVFGHPTLSREVPALLARDDVEVIVVRSAGEPVDPFRAAATLVDAVSVGSGDGETTADDARTQRAWVGRWVHASRAILDATEIDPATPLAAIAQAQTSVQRNRFARNELKVFRAPVTRAMLALAMWRASWPHDRLVLGASRMVRELDAIAPGKNITVRANRGLAGIDGTVSTALGIALASQSNDKPGVTRVLLGDLTLLHDVGGLLMLRHERRPRIQFIVANDQGGSIFDSLEVAQSAPESSFDRVFRTPHDVDLASIAAAYGIAHQVVTSRGDLDRALTVPALPLSILEVQITE